MPVWSHRIILDGVNVTDRTLLGASAEETENASALCDFVYLPTSGAQDPDGLHLVTVDVDVDVGAGWQAMFSGRVIRAEWEQKSRRYTIRASNRMQEHFRALGTNQAVLAALPGAVYSDALFGEPDDDLWIYAQKCMETIEKDVYIDRSGTLTLVDWAAKGAADEQLDESLVHNHGAFDLARPDADDVINEVIVTYEYRVSRQKVRKHVLTWNAWRNNVSINNWCEYAVGPQTAYHFPLPKLSLVENTMLGGSWDVPAGVRYGVQPASDSNLCGGLLPAWINPEVEGAEVLVTSAGVDGYSAFHQPLRETYTLTISALASQSYYGATVTDAKSGSSDVKRDESWPPQESQPQPTWNIDSIGDSYQDQEDETRRANDLTCGYQWARWRIFGSNRGISLTVNTDLSPHLTQGLTVSISAYGLQAKGKVRRLLHVLDAGDGNPHTQVTIALSRGAGGSDDPFSVPARPDTSDVGYPASADAQSYNTYVGGWLGAAPAPVPDTRLGWITQCDGTKQDPAAEQYGSVFNVEWPEIEDEAAGERLEPVPSIFEISVPQDDLVMP